MQNITTGQLRVFTYSHIYTFPAPKSRDDEAELKAELRVANSVFWVRLCAMSDLGFAGNSGAIYLDGVFTAPSQKPICMEMLSATISSRYSLYAFSFGPLSLYLKPSLSRYSSKTEKISQA